MKKGRVTLLVAIIATLVAGIASSGIPAHSASTDQPLGSIKVTKSVPSVSLNNEISVTLTIQNNGTIPVFDLEIYEYMNANLQVRGNIEVNELSANSAVPVASGGVTSVAQVIVDPPPPNTLMPGEKMTLKYVQIAPKAGDFQIPTSLIWFSFKYGGSTIRSSIYSNGLMVHVPNDFEKAIFLIYPYVLAAATFSSTITILLWARTKLAKLKKGILH